MPCGMSTEAESCVLVSQILKELTMLSSASSGGGSGSQSDLEPLQRLAAELALVASAAQAGTRARVVGRSRGMCDITPYLTLSGPPAGWQAMCWMHRIRHRLNVFVCIVRCATLRPHHNICGASAVA